MKKLILLVLLNSVIFGWDCSYVNNTANVSDDLICRRAAYLETSIHTDNYRDNTSFSVSQLKNEKHSEVVQLLMQEAETCFTSCMKALKSRK